MSRLSELAYLQLHLYKVVTLVITPNHIPGWHIGTSHIHVDEQIIFLVFSQCSVSYKIIALQVA